jgi:hypothetical protein
MIRFIFLLAFFFFLLGPLFNLLGQQADPSLIGRIADLKVRAQDHESQVANLLAKPSIPRTNFELPFSKVVEIENLPASQIPFIPVPEYVDGDSDLVREIPPSSTAADESVNVDKGINAVNLPRKQNWKKLTASFTLQNLIAASKVTILDQYSEWFYPKMGLFVLALITHLLEPPTPRTPGLLWAHKLEKILVGFEQNLNILTLVLMHRMVCLQVCITSWGVLF